MLGLTVAAYVIGRLVASRLYEARGGDPIILGAAAVVGVLRAE